MVEEGAGAASMRRAPAQKLALVLRYEELSRIESVCFLYSIVASSGRPITLRIVSRICMHTLRESADLFHTERMSSW